MTSPATSEDEERPRPSKEDNAENLETYLVKWEEDDRANPRNWSTGYRRWITFQLAMVAMAASLEIITIQVTPPVL
jgi:hypothetical protein